jgi:tungstate transport system permease protein
MSDIVDGLRQALRLLFAGDLELYGIIGRTLLVSSAATCCALVIGVPLGYTAARGRFPGRTFLLSAVNTGMGMPPVVVGLVVWLLLARSGPLGGLELIYTKTAIVIAQFVISLPLIVGFTAASVQALPPQLPDLLTTLGAGRARSLWLLGREARLGILAGVMAGFGAVVSEVGASMTVGGNLQGSTRVLTTAIVTTTSRGELPLALALGIILLALAFAVNGLLTALQQRRDG